MRIAGFDAADLVGGLLVFAGGCAVALGATSYQIGELTRMGPGYFRWSSESRLRSSVSFS
jgi:hypothetical protein